MRLTFCLFLLPVLLWSQTPAKPALNITHLTGDFYIYTTYNDYKGEAVPSNSLYVLTDAGAILLDTPWDTAQCQPLLDSIRARHGKEVVFCLSTHFHADRTAGIDHFKARGIRTYASCLTLDWCRKEGEPLPQYCFAKDTTFSIGKLDFETFYPGAGHAPDNIVVWFPKEKILYGGCFVKSLESTGLGNLSHAYPAEWAKSVKKVQRKYRKPRHIIPGHYGWQGNGLRHTAKLLKKHHPKQQ
ncbi:MAG: subclass B1 metallo-beta-lactamase [Saprospiraceae bacterium]|nr:subclass B1 metallo-beta-lactamase [Saprospiraceae bacterium]